MVGRTLVIAGGVDGFSTLRTTESLNLDTKAISYGPSMATPRTYFHLVAIHGPRLLAIGGSYALIGGSYAGSWTIHASVEELVDGAWVEAAPLEARSSSYGAVAVPEGLACA